MSKKDDELNPKTPWYQNVTIVLSWLWAGVNTLIAFLGNVNSLEILSRWITWPFTITGSILVILILAGLPIFIKIRKPKFRSPETGRTRIMEPPSSKILVMGIGILIALWIPRIGEWYVPHKTGDIRIAVADFIVVDDSLPSSLGQELSQYVYDSIQQNITNIESDYGKAEVEILPPNKTPNISGFTQNQIEASVEAVLRNSEADIIIYAIITKGMEENTAEVEPFFFLAENSVFGFPEFTGQDAWTSKFLYSYDNSIESNLQRDYLTEMLSQRTKAFTYSVYGAWKYNLGDYQASYGLFQKAVERSSLEDKIGVSVWYLWWGNATLKLGDYENAYKYYQAALDYRPGYARAYIGLANTTISKANFFLSTSGLSNVQDYIDTTNAFLDGARNAADNPSSADIQMKTEFVLGQIAQTKFHYYAPHDINLLNEAESHYRNVVNDYVENKNRRIKEHAGLAYMHLGEIEINKQRYDLASIDFNFALEILRDKHAIAISHDEQDKEDYSNRIKCWKSLTTPIPQDMLICP